MTPRSITGGLGTGLCSLQGSAIRLKKYYDQRAQGGGFIRGGLVWLHQVRLKKGACPKLQNPWCGLSDVTFIFSRDPVGSPRWFILIGLRTSLGIFQKDGSSERHGRAQIGNAILGTLRRLPSREKSAWATRKTWSASR